MEQVALLKPLLDVDPRKLPTQLKPLVEEIPKPLMMLSAANRRLGKLDASNRIVFELLDCLNGQLLSHFGAEFYRAIARPPSFNSALLPTEAHDGHAARFSASVSASRRARKRSPESNTDRKHSPESKTARKHSSESNTARKHSSETNTARSGSRSRSPRRTYSKREMSIIYEAKQANPDLAMDELAKVLYDDVRMHAERRHKENALYQKLLREFPNDRKVARSPRTKTAKSRSRTPEKNTTVLTNAPLSVVFPGGKNTQVFNVQQPE
ncbi:hypothetical protein AAVH_03321 [Aphelenchoides avenae]|nr:hypothetical protein AAVH_03321 [Aphelenchus avenae]